MNHALLRNRGLGRRGLPGPPRTRHPAHHAPPPRGRPPLAWTGILLLPGISQGRCRGAPRLQSRSAALAPGPPPHELAAEVTPPAPMCGRAHVCVCVCVCVCARARVCVCVCVYIYTHKQTNKHTHTHTHTHMRRYSRSSRGATCRHQSCNSGWKRGGCKRRRGGSSAPTREEQARHSARSTQATSTRAQRNHHLTR